MKNNNTKKIMHKEISASVSKPERTPGLRLSAVSSAQASTVHGISINKLAACDPAIGPNPLHYHDCYEMIWMRSDSYAEEQIIENCEIPLSGGTLFLLPFHRVHRLNSCTQKTFGYLINFAPYYFDYSDNPAAKGLVMDWAHIMQMMHQRDPKKLCITPSAEHAARLDALCAEIYAIELKRQPTVKQRSSPFTEECNRALIPLYREIFDIAAQEFYAQCSPEELSILEKYRAPMLRCLQYIDEHISEKIMLDDLCDVLGFKSAWLLKLFSGMFGISPMDYINFVRMRRARYLLVNTDMSMGDISAACGYQSQIYFNRVFKDYNGCIPKTYRNEYDIEWID